MFCQLQSNLKRLVGERFSVKTTSGVYNLLQHTKPAGSYLVCVPSLKFLKSSTIRTFLDLAPYDSVYTKSKLLLTLPCRATVLFASTRSSAIYSNKFNGIWIDEASLVTEDQYRAVVDRLLPDGWVAITYTDVRDETHWTNRLRRPWYGVLTRLEHNPGIPDSVIEAIRKFESGTANTP